MVKMALRVACYKYWVMGAGIWSSRYPACGRLFYVISLIAPAAPAGDNTSPDIRTLVDAAGGFFYIGGSV
jgi:hypothetical protein